MIKIKNLCMKYDDRILFDNAEFEIADNQITVITGPNGVGKTTLMKIIIGSVKADNAVIENNFKELFFLPQKICYPRGITLFEYVTSVYFKNSLKWYLSREEKEKTSEILNELELFDRKNIFVENLSSGELQKADIALALISGADCLLLDEPTSNLDLINQIKILDIIKKLAEKKVTSVVVMHDLNLSASFGDSFIGINKNYIVQTSKEEFFYPNNLEKIFGIKFEVVKNDKNFHIQFFN